MILNNVILEDQILYQDEPKHRVGKWSSHHRNIDKRTEIGQRW